MTKAGRRESNEIVCVSVNVCVCVCVSESVRVKSLSSQTSSLSPGLVLERWCKFFLLPFPFLFHRPPVCSLFSLSSPPAALCSPTSSVLPFAVPVCSLILPSLPTQISLSPDLVWYFSVKPFQTISLSLSLSFCLLSNPLLLPPSLPLSCPLSRVTNNSNLNKKAKENPLVTESLEKRERDRGHLSIHVCVCVCVCLSKREGGWRERKNRGKKGEKANTRTIIGICINPSWSLSYIPDQWSKHTHSIPVTHCISSRHTHSPTRSFPLCLHKYSLSFKHTLLSWFFYTLTASASLFMLHSDNNFGIPLVTVVTA